MAAFSIEGVKQWLSRVSAEHRELLREMVGIRTEYGLFRKACEDTPHSITHEIDSIPGRRIFFNLTAELSFTAANAGQRGQPMQFRITQDGTFIMTHYPMPVWRPEEPVNATLIGRWRPVATWPLPDQVIDSDVIDLSYEFQSGGSQRNFNNQKSGPIFSRPDNLVPLPVPTIITPNDVVEFIPTFEAINFDGTLANPTTGGRLVVTLPGYRIVNL